MSAGVKILPTFPQAQSDSQEEIIYWGSGILQVSASPELTDTTHSMQLHSVR